MPFRHSTNAEIQAGDDHNEQRKAEANRNNHNDQRREPLLGWRAVSDHESPAMKNFKRNILLIKEITGNQIYDSL